MRKGDACLCVCVCALLGATHCIVYVGVELQANKCPAMLFHPSRWNKHERLL